MTYTHCTLCPRRCGVDRTAGQLGFCKMSDRVKLARAAAQLRRAAATPAPTELRVADLRMDLVARKVYRGNTRILLQPLEFQLLEFLMRNRGRVVSRTTIMEHVWEYNFDPHTNVVDSRICHLRDKIDKNFQPRLLKTIRGFGYVLEDS